MISFAAAVVLGMVADNPASVVIWRALVVMAVSWAVGLSVGLVAQRTIEEHLSAYKRAHPIPDESEVEASAEAEGQEDQERTMEENGQSSQEGEREVAAASS